MQNNPDMTEVLFLTQLEEVNLPARDEQAVQFASQQTGGRKEERFDLLSFPRLLLSVGIR